MFNRFLHSYFGFNKQQRNGVYVLCCICLILLLIRMNIHRLIPEKEINVENFSNITDTSTIPPVGSDEESKRTIHLFAFDPNTVSKEELIRLGFREKTANTYIKFRSKGFVFKHKEDLKKIYGVDERLYNTLEPYIIISSQKPSGDQTIYGSQGSSKPGVTIELNKADSLSLISLKGVGPSYAKRILKYRELLGGYYDISQLKEVYGMTDELHELLKQQCKIDASLIRKLNVNSLEFKALNKHPYISYELTKQLVNFRKHTALSPDNIGDVIQDETLTKQLLPYLEY